jgi:hypothetical protein
MNAPVENDNTAYDSLEIKFHSKRASVLSALRHFHRLSELIKHFHFDSALQSRIAIRPFVVAISTPFRHRTLPELWPAERGATTEWGGLFLSFGMIWLLGSTWGHRVDLFEGGRWHHKFWATMLRLKEAEASAQGGSSSAHVVGMTSQTLRTQPARPSAQDQANRGATNRY